MRKESIVKAMSILHLFVMQEELANFQFVYLWPVKYRQNEHTKKMMRKTQFQYTNMQIQNMYLTIVGLKEERNCVEMCPFLET